MLAMHMQGQTAIAVKSAAAYAYATIMLIIQLSTIHNGAKECCCAGQLASLMSRQSDCV